MSLDSETVSSVRRFLSGRESYVMGNGRRLHKKTIPNAETDSLPKRESYIELLNEIKRRYF